MICSLFFLIIFYIYIIAHLFYITAALQQCKYLFLFLFLQNFKSSMNKLDLHVFQI